MESQCISQRLKKTPVSIWINLTKTQYKKEVELSGKKKNVGNEFIIF